MSWNQRHLLSLRELSRLDLELILDTARAFKQGLLTQEVKKTVHLLGKTVVNLFVEPSTRTRTSFDLAANRLSADVVSFNSEFSSFRKGETLKDTALNLQAMGADFVILRHGAAGSAQFLAERLEARVINAGDGAHEHPTQGLLDLFTVREKVGHTQGLKIVIVGDILFSRVARSAIWAFSKCGVEITLVGPATLLPPVFKELGVQVVHSLEEVLPEANVIMLLRIQHERQRQIMFPSLGEYTAFFGLTAARFTKCRSDVLIMHPGPINRGVEIDSSLADGPNSVILDQVTNGLAVRMAVLYLLNGGGGPHGVMP
jgi:aspartate carbamoyltransferase catalytic subunit